MNIGLNKVLDPACGVLDMCCGCRYMHFDKEDPRVLFCDIRDGEFPMVDKGKERLARVHPDVQIDFRNLPAWWTESFSLVIFDPPHLLHAGKKSFMRAKYGVLDREQWRSDLHLGFLEGFRVLKPGGTLIFKWSEVQIKISEVIPLAHPHKPIFRSSRGGTHFIVFHKTPTQQTQLTQ